MKLPLEYVPYRDPEMAGSGTINDADNQVIAVCVAGYDARALVAAANAVEGLAASAAGLLQRLGRISLASTPEANRVRAALAAYHEKEPSP